MKFKLVIVLIVCMCLYQNICPKIRLLSINFNRPEFIPLQYKTLKKFLKEKDDFELIVFNDANNNFFKNKITKTCKDLGIQCVEIPQSYHHSGALYAEAMKLGGLGENNASIYHCEAIQYALDKFGYNHDDIVGLLEEDVFMLRDFSIREAMRNYDIIGGRRYEWSSNPKISFLWIGLTFINMKNLPHKETLCFDLTWINDIFLDSGGSTYYYLKNNPQVRYKMDTGVQFSHFASYDSSQLRLQGFSDAEIHFIRNILCYLKKIPIGAIDCNPPMEFYFNYSFVHHACARLNKNLKTLIFKKFLNAILS